MSTSDVPNPHDPVRSEQRSVADHAETAFALEHRAAADESSRRYERAAAASGGQQAATQAKPQLATVAGVRPHQANAFEINLDRLHLATRAAWNDGFTAGEREGHKAALRTWLASCLVIGFLAGALLRHLLGSLT